MTPARGRLWVIVGATGTGKSRLALDLAETLVRRGRAAEVVNADAMQLYAGMDIGTAKVPEAERRGIPHHLFDVLRPSDEATVAGYQPAARRIIGEITSAGADAILVGGSGLYVSSVVFDFRFPPRDQAVRAELERDLERVGPRALYERLQVVDPQSARHIDARNTRRVVRALELATLGASAHAVLPEAPETWHGDTRLVGVSRPRAELVPVLDARVRDMWRQGLVAEVERLLPAGIADGPTASHAIGYAQALQQLRGELDEADAIAQTQQLTRRYARRQVSWFKRYAGVTWVGSDDVEANAAVLPLLDGGGTATP